MHTSTRQPRGEIGVGIEFGAELVVGGEEADVADFKNSSWDRCGQSHRVTPIPRGRSDGVCLLLLRNSPCWERGCKRAGQSPKNFPTKKNFLPQIPGLGTEVFQPLKVLGQDDFMGRAQPCADCFFGKKMCGKR